MNFDYWEEVNKKIEINKSFRYSWKRIFGQTLTSLILTYKNQGLTAIETFLVICSMEQIREATKHFPGIAEDMKDKIKISVCARYGEQQTASKILGGYNGTKKI